MICRSLFLFLLFDIGDANSNVYADRCIDHTCGVQLTGSVADALEMCDCTEYDIGATETLCRLDNTLDIIYFWKLPATCKANKNVLKLPEPITNIECGRKCSQGSYIEYNRTSKAGTCLTCSPGHYSMGGGQWYGPSWVPGALPTQFTSSCYSEDKIEYDHDNQCHHWTGMGQQIETGDSSESHSMDALLELQVDLAIDGYIYFLYQVEAEHPYDHFLFIIDKDVSLQTTENAWGDWAVHNVSLSQGHHWLRWIFRKDISISQGKDMAKIREIVVMGLQNNDYQCLKCPPGRFANASGQNSCYPCPQNTFSGTGGATECTPCGTSEMSAPGSSICLPSLPCTEFDYFWEAGPCIAGPNGGRTTLTPIWVEPKKCFMKDLEWDEIIVGSSSEDRKIIDIVFPETFLHRPTIVFEWTYNISNIRAIAVTLKSFQMELVKKNGWQESFKVRWEAKAQGIDLPNPKINVKCNIQETTCLAGQEWDDSAQQCVNCPLGKANAVDGGTCEVCAEGHGATEYIWHSFHWDGLDPFSTYCNGDCGTPGWRFGGDFLDSGAGHQVGTESSLTLFFNNNIDPVYSTLWFEYTLSCAQFNSLEVFLDDSLVHREMCGSPCDHSKREMTLDIPQLHLYDQNHTLMWTYHKVSYVPEKYAHTRCDYARLYDIKLLEGHIYHDPNNLTVTSKLGGAQFCKNCPAGKYGSGMYQVCRSCQPGMHAPSEGELKCHQCPTNSIAYKYGTSECIECGQSTVAIDEVKCGIDCNNVIVQDLNTYNLSGLPKFKVIKANQSNVNYYFSICKPLERPLWTTQILEEGWSEISPYSLASGVRTNVAIAVTENGKANLVVSAGGIASFHGNTSLEIDFTYGSSVTCWILNGSGITLVKRRLQTKVIMPCSLGAGEGTPEPLLSHDFIEVNEDQPPIGPCTSQFEWPSKYGCPICQPSDFGAVYSKCVDGKLTKSYVWTVSCSGGVSLPASQRESCVMNAFVLSEGGAAGVGIAAVIFVVCVGVILYRKLPEYFALSKEHRRLNEQYETLKQQRGRSSFDGDDTD